MNTSKIVLLLCALGSFFAFAGDYDSVVDDSVVGYWRFNNPNDYGKDSSGHGSRIVQWNNGASGGAVSGDWSRGGGCLELPRNGTKSSNYTYGNAFDAPMEIGQVRFSNVTREERCAPAIPTFSIAKGCRIGRLVIEDCRAINAAQGELKDFVNDGVIGELIRR